jgi:hypothetical protein
MRRELKRKKEFQCEDPIPDQHVKEGPLEPGMSMSVKTMRRSLRDSRMVMASVGVGCFDRYESCRLYRIGRMKPTKNLILDNWDMRS